MGNRLHAAISIAVYLNIIEHERVVAHSQGLPTGGSDVPEDDRSGSDIGEFFPVGLVRHLWIEICKEGGALVVLRVVGIVDMKRFDGDPFRHVGGIAEIVVPRVEAEDQAGIDDGNEFLLQKGISVFGRHKHAVAYNDLALPRTAIIATQVDEVRTVDGGILHGQNPAADGVDAHVSKGRVADRRIGNPHMGVEARQRTIVIHKVLAVIGCHDSPILGVIDVIRLAAIDE